MTTLFISRTTNGGGSSIELQHFPLPPLMHSLIFPFSSFYHHNSPFTNTTLNFKSHPSKTTIHYNINIIKHIVTSWRTLLLYFFVLIVCFYKPFVFNLFAVASSSSSYFTKNDRCYPPPYSSHLFFRRSISPNVVKIKYGILRGVVFHLGSSPFTASSYNTSYNHTKTTRTQLSPVEAYLGVPYASPPTGALRFMPPVTPAHWRGIRLATQLAPLCPQRLPFDDILQNNSTEALKRMPLARFEWLRRQLPRIRANQSEDCLYLNIYTPAVMMMTTFQNDNNDVKHNYYHQKKDDDEDGKSRTMMSDEPVTSYNYIHHQVRKNTTKSQINSIKNKKFFSFSNLIGKFFSNYQIEIFDRSIYNCLSFSLIFAEFLHTLKCNSHVTFN